MEEPRNESEVVKLKKALENAEKALKEKEKALKEKEEAENKYKQLISSPVKVTRSGRAVQDWKDLIGDLFDDDEGKHIIKALRGVEMDTCDELDINSALAYNHVRDVRDKTERIWKELRIKKRKMSTPSPTKSMADEKELAPESKRIQKATFWYLGCKPVKAMTDVPPLDKFETYVVNGYVGSPVFSNHDGVFVQRGTSGGRRMYLFQFSTRDACSSTSDNHFILQMNIHSDYLDEDLFIDNLFQERATSPGKIFFSTEKSLNVENGTCSLNIKDNLEMIRNLDEKVLEDTITIEMSQSLMFLQSDFKVKCLSFDCTYSPFSGGGDISVFRKSSVGAFSLTHSSIIDPNSPNHKTGDCKFAFDIENKINTTDPDSLERQLLANMMVTLSMLIEQMCRDHNKDLHDYQAISVYGLSLTLNHFAPMKLYKLTMDFNSNKVQVLRKAAFRRGLVPSLTLDCIITYMIRNI